MVNEVCIKVTLHGFGGAAIGPEKHIAPAGGRSRLSNRDNA
jgi:hypothetical protein